MDTKSDYIAQMVLETLEITDGNLYPLHSVRRQAEMKFDSPQIIEDKSRKCLLFNGFGSSFEVPLAWGPFSNFQDSIKLTKDNDPYFFLEAMEVAFGRSLQSIEISKQNDQWQLFIEQAEEVGKAA